MKMVVANMPFYDRDKGFETAEILNDVIIAVENGK